MKNSMCGEKSNTTVCIKSYLNCDIQGNCITNYMQYDILLNHASYFIVDKIFAMLYKSSKITYFK